MTYQTLQQKLLGLAFILGPLLLIIGAAVYLLGIERSPDGTSSWVEGIFMAFGILLMVPAYLALAGILGQRAPFLGILLTVTGLGYAVGIIPATARILQMDLITAGLNESVWQVLLKHPGWIPLLLWGALGIFTPLFLGTGFLWKGGIPRWTAILCILAPIFFIIGQGGDDTIAWWQVTIFYPLASLTYLAALAPIGLRYLSADNQTYEMEMATA